MHRQLRIIHMQIYICMYLLTCTDLSLCQETCKEGYQCKFSMNKYILCNICNAHYMYKCYEYELCINAVLLHTCTYLCNVSAFLLQILYIHNYTITSPIAHVCSQMLISKAVFTYIHTYIYVKVGLKMNYYVVKSEVLWNFKLIRTLKINQCDHVYTVSFKCDIA